MTALEVPHADLIAEARQAAEAWGPIGSTGPLFAALADALAALGEQKAALGREWVDVMRLLTEARTERDAFAARMTEVRARARTEAERGQSSHPMDVRYFDGWRRSAEVIFEGLATDPAVSLAQHDAKVWDEGAEYAVGYSAPPLYDNPYRATASAEGAS